MAMSDLRVWAIKGAEQRLVEIANEAKAIFAMFPELRKQGSAFSVPGSGKTGRTEPGEGAAPRRRRKMSAAARKRIGDAQRARWAKQKGAKGGDQTNSLAPGQPIARRARKKR
jgi:hypothetical protein